MRGGAAVVKLYVPLRPQEIDRLVAVANAERRRPADQAAHMLSRLLAEQGTKREGVAYVQD